MTAASKQDGSPSLLATLASSLLSSFSPTDVVSDSGKSNCDSALIVVSSLSRNGYLDGSPANTQLLAQLISSFTVKSPVSAYSNSLATYNVSKAAVFLIEGVQLGMASGEAPVSVVTSNVQLSVTSTLVTASSNLVLTTPATASQEQYGAIQPKVTLGQSGLKNSPFSGGYAHLSVLQWSVNPYPESMRIKSPLLRLSSAIQSSTATVLNNGPISAQVQPSSATFTLQGTPAYYVALQFSSIQNFNFSAVSNGMIKIGVLQNVTVPGCALYNGVAYVACAGCNISTYTDYNVTFGCYDITQLYQSVPIAGSDSVASLSYGVLFQSILGELSDVLSTNPFKLNVVNSTIVLGFMGCLCGVMGVIIYYLVRVDRNEKLYKNYVKSEADNLARKLLKDDIAKGGNGDLGNSFQGHVNALNRSIKSVQGFRSLLTRSLLGRKDKDTKLKADNSLGVKFDFSNVEDNDNDSDDDEKKNIRKGDRRYADRFDVNQTSSNTIRTVTDAGSRNNLYDDFDSTHGDGDDRKYNNDAMDTKEKYYRNSSEKLIEGINNYNSTSKAKEFGTAAVVTEFVSKLFPGRSIFSKRSNAMEIVGVHHYYFAMFVSSTVTLSRTLRFLYLVSLILTTIFVDTLFFGIFYSDRSPCGFMNDEVNNRPYFYISFYTGSYFGLSFHCFFCPMST